MDNTIASKKYELTNERYVIEGITLHRIRALRDFDDVKAGDLGGLVENESNLSHDGNCWVYDDAVVSHGAIVSENAKVRNDAYVLREARASGNAVISDKARILGRDAYIHGNAKICDCAIICGEIYGNAIVCNKAKVATDAKIYDNAKILNSACVGGFIYGNAKISGSACIYPTAEIYDNAWIYGKAKVYYFVKIDGNTVIKGNQKIYKNIHGNYEFIDKTA